MSEWTERETNKSVFKSVIKVFFKSVVKIFVKCVVKIFMKRVVRIFFKSVAKVREDDVWIASFPKCGTTWTQVIPSGSNHFLATPMMIIMMVMTMRIEDDGIPCSGNGLEYNA